MFEYIKEVELEGRQYPSFALLYITTALFNRILFRGTFLDLKKTANDGNTLDKGSEIIYHFLFHKKGQLFLDQNIEMAFSLKLFSDSNEVFIFCKENSN